MKDKYFDDYTLEDIDDHHTELVRKLAKPGEAITASMTAKQAHLLHMAVGVAGEAGELLDAIKKHVIYNKPLDETNVIEELGDLLFYMEGIARTIPTSLAECKIQNIIKLEKRYGHTYSDEAAQARVDKNGS